MKRKPKNDWTWPAVRTVKIEGPPVTGFNITIKGDTEYTWGSISLGTASKCWGTIYLDASSNSYLNEGSYSIYINAAGETTINAKLKDEDDE